MKVRDTGLASYATCPLGKFGSGKSATETCAVGLLRWLTLEVFNGRLVPLPIIRKKFVSLWHSEWPENVTRDGEVYWTGVRTGRSLAARLWTLFNKYKVLRPFQFYELPVGEHAVTGDYAIIGRRKPDSRVQEGPYILVYHSHRPITFSRPDLAALARWKHAMMSGEYVGLGIYHLPLLRGQYWRDRDVTEPLVMPWLTSILESMDRNLCFPAPSGYCEGCVGKACMDVFTT